MFELLSLVFGGLLRLAPEALKLISAKRDQAHELEMTRLQLDIDKARAAQQIDLVHAQGAMAADAADSAALLAAIQAQAAPSGVPWVDALSSSVRPVLAYWWAVGLYTLYKIVTIVVAVQQNAQLAVLAPVLVTDFDKQVIASIIAFWYVDRSLRRGRI